MSDISYLLLLRDETHPSMYIISASKTTVFDKQCDNDDVDGDDVDDDGGDDSGGGDDGAEGDDSVGCSVTCLC